MWRSRHVPTADNNWQLINGFATLLTMRAPENKVLRHKSISFLLAFALCFLAVFNVSSASTFPNHAESALQSLPIDSGLASNTHKKHALNDSGEFCQNPSYKTVTDCTVACSMSMGCASPSVLLATTSPYAQAKSTVHFSVSYSSTWYTSTQFNSLYRPPIC